ncbi:MAG: cation diffusion facilitator family transporter [Alphaproteobacteria bacterium]
MTHRSTYDGALVRYATYASVSVALLLIGVKFYAWWISNSVSLQATLIDSLLDAAASIVNMFAVRHAQRPPDSQHRFGYGKAEGIAALGQSVFIAGSAVWLVYEASQRLFAPVIIQETGIGIAVMALSMLVTLGLIMFQTYVVKRTRSAAIKADSVHYRSDFLINGGVIVSLLLTQWTGVFWIDPLVGGGIALYILYTAWTIVREALDILMDRELPDSIRNKVRDISLSHKDVRGIHEFRTRSSGLRDFVQLHLELDGHITLDEAHRIADEVEAMILEDFPDADVLIHQDPVRWDANGKRVAR